MQLGPLGLTPAWASLNPKTEGEAKKGDRKMTSENMTTGLPKTKPLRKGRRERILSRLCKNTKKKLPRS